MQILLIMTIFGIVCSKTAIDCPGKCECDKWMNLKRVKCSNQNLMNIGDDIPSSVEILDISYNQINQLYENEFTKLGLNSVKLLNISNNKIGHMSLNAFKNMDKLRIIDLSFNIIEYILLDWFSGIPNLKELYISNNNLFDFPSDIEGSLVESKTLEVLDISYCKITRLKAEAFSKLPNLKTLKLDGNFLLDINPLTMENLKNLQSLTVNDNPFSCGKDMNDFKRYMKNVMNVKYVDPCSKPKVANVERSQKMITLEETVEESNLWKYDDEETKNDTSCNSTVTVVEKKGLIMEIIEMSPILSLLITFVTGLLVGLIIACNVQIKPPKSTIPRRPRRYSIIRRTYLENSDPLVLNCENVYESTPVPQRKIEMFPLR